MQTLYCISRDLQFENKILRSTRDDVNLTFQNGVDVQFQKKDKEMNEKRDELKTLCFRKGRERKHFNAAAAAAVHIIQR